jgi:hypothetical protein
MFSLDFLLETGETKNRTAASAPKPPIYGEFKLPISHLPSDQIFPLSETVEKDLELVTCQSSNSKSMYEHLFQPSHPFAKDTIQEWKRSYTTNVGYLGETQKVIGDMVKFDEHKIDHDAIMELWKDTKENEYFLEKYCFMEWDMLKSLNQSSSFLQILSVGNILSPAMSLILPLMFFIFPFIILKIRGIPITFSFYLEVLKDIAKNHFIGKTLLNLSEISWDKAAYLLVTIGLYFYQIYQNVLLCHRFYHNVHKINQSLCMLREYLGNTCSRMDLFVKLHAKKSGYGVFCSITKDHSEKLKELHGELESIRPFDTTLGLLSKIGQIGYLLKCYYQIHENEDYERSLRYSFGFEGYLDNLLGVYGHMTSGAIHSAFFSESKKTRLAFIKQYYPAYLDKPHVKNDCSLKKNMIITGPNAAGKTTFLKSTTINVIFTQQIGCGFYSSGVIMPYTHIHSYLNIPDTSERDSLFQAESRRCKEIIDTIRDYPSEKGFRHFCIFDELYSGTNPKEAAKSAGAFLRYLGKHKQVDFILTTHYTSICKKLEKSKTVVNYKMDVSEKEDGSIEYTYRIVKGISNVEGAVRILEQMNYPKEIMDAIRADP